MLVVTFSALTFTPISAQESTLRSGAFVTTLGRDTTAVEKYTRSARRLEGEILTRNPLAVQVRYTLDFDAHGNALELQLTGRSLAARPDAPPLLVRNAVVRGDTVDNDVRRNGQVDANATGRLAIARGALPFISNSTAIYEEAGLQWKNARRDSTGVSMFTFGAQGTGPAAPLMRFAGDTLVLVLGPGQRSLIYLDRTGRLQKVDNRLTTVRTVTRRVANLDMNRIARDFAATGALGLASPRDTVRNAIGSAQLLIDYGRPSARGRKVFGTLVPFDTIWRTGANLATHFTTSHDLIVGDVRIPAGSYTLWTVLSPKGDTLVVNKQTGQWGTLYDPTKDLVHIPLRTDNTVKHVEQFTINIVPSPTGADLVMTWERRRMRVNLRAG